MNETKPCTIPGCIEPRMKGRSICLKHNRERVARWCREKRAAEERAITVVKVETSHGFAIRMLVEAAKR